MSDHWHHASEIQGAADDRHGHPDLERDISSVESDLRNHRHYDLERTIDELRGQIRELRAIMIEFGLDLSEAQGRIHQLEQQTPEARQAEYEADIALADAAESGYDDLPGGEA
jgi:peptidoglycan hydrolase CwlO-like protein